MKSELEFLDFRTGDEEHILELFHLSYGRHLCRDVWAWRFRDNVAGPGVVDLCWDGGLLAAHYAVSQVVMRIAGSERHTGLSGTTMTHPGYRGMRLFPRLARRTYDRMRELNMAMVWGFPNSFSHRGLIRDLNWVDLYEIPTLRLQLSRSLVLPALSDRVLELDQFDSRFDRLWESVRDDYLVLTRRDQQYLQWRYVSNPSGRYRILAHTSDGELLGYLVFKHYFGEVQVVDLLTVLDTDVAARLISQAAHIATQNSAQALSLWLNVTHPLHRELEKLGFRNGEPVTYFGGLLLGSELRSQNLYDYRNWYLTMGDSDVF